MNLTNLWGRAIKHSLFNRSVDRAPGAMRRAVRPFGQPRSAPPQPCPVRRDPRGCSSPFPRRASLWRRLRLRENAATRLRGARACLALLAAAALPRLAALLLVLAASLAAAENAAARSVTLVSNANQGLDTSSTAGRNRAQAFTTGAVAATLSSVEIISEDSEGDDATVSLCTVDADNLPTSSCTALTAPSSFAAGTLVFTAPANTTLAANTTYSLLVTSPGSDYLVLDVTLSGAEDAGGTTGWSIANNFHSLSRGTTSTWATHTMRALRITIKDASANNAPTVATEIPDRTATADAAFSYAFPADTFTDADGDTLTYTATKSDDSALPAWLSFAAATRTFSGTPQATDVETVSVKVTASDGTDSVTESVSDTFDIVVNVAGTNNAPTVAHAIPDRMAPAGTALSYAFPANTFNDTDAGNTLTYTATKSDDSELPSWLSFAPATRRFSGTPTAADAGTVSVKVTASDGTDSVSVTFDIVVSASTNTAPTAADKTVTTAQDTNYTFTPFNFGYVDADDDSLVSVLIVTVPAEGALALNGVAVMASRTVTRAEISDGGLKFEPATGESGGPYTNFTFKVNDGTDDSVSAYTMTINVMIVSAPGAPTALTATASGQAWIELAWTAPVHAGGRAITGYRIEVSPDGSTWSDLVAATASTATTYVHKGLSAGATRHYRVSAINSAINVVGASDSSGSDHATTRTDEQLVSNFNHRGRSDNHNLAYEKVAGIFTTGSRDARLNSIELKLGHRNRAFVPTELKLYEASTGEGFRRIKHGLEEVATLTVPARRLSVPANSHQTFSYDAPSGTSLTASTKYIFVLQPSTAGIIFVETTIDSSEDAVKADGWTIDGSGRGRTSPYSISPNQQIVVRVNGTTGTVTTTAPGAPTGLTATAKGQSQIDLAWTAPANTGGSPITGYKIEVSPNGSSSWSDRVANTESTATTYAHTGLNAATTRHYRVSAINDVGTSVASISDDATTEAAPPPPPAVAAGRRSSPSTPPPPPDDVVGYLENPGAASFQSGIGLISGWTCDAEAVEIVLNGEPQDAAYGTARLDTEAVCGDSDNGFGLLFNWNLLGDGEHEVVALVDGVELDRATVTVTTLGTEFLRDVTGRCTAADFPTMDETVTLAWQQTQQNFVIVDGMPPTGENRTGTPGVGYLENPGPNSFQSGIGVLSGWACEGTEVIIELNGQPQPAAYGTERLDTLAACGDTANGFGLLFNWNLLGEGEHEVVAFVDGEELGRATVRVTTLGAEFVRDVEGECTVEDFPMLGETVTLEWQQNSQNFVITEVE